jgi:hypothetical protein
MADLLKPNLPKQIFWPKTLAAVVAVSMVYGCQLRVRPSDHTYAHLERVDLTHGANILEDQIDFINSELPALQSQIYDVRLSLDRCSKQCDQEGLEKQIKGLEKRTLFLEEDKAYLLESLRTILWMIEGAERT